MSGPPIPGDPPDSGNPPNSSDPPDSSNPPNSSDPPNGTEPAKSPLEFPSEFPIKVVGRQDGDLRALTRVIIERHAGPLEDSSVRSRTSSDGNFLSLTYMVNATSREQLDAIYRELTACKSVLMAL